MDPEKPSRVPRYATKGLLQEYGHMYPFPDRAREHQVVVKHGIANGDVRSREHATWDMIVGIFAQWCAICLHSSLQVGSTAIPRNSGLADQHVVGLRGETL